MGSDALSALILRCQSSSINEGLGGGTGTTLGTTHAQLKATWNSLLSVELWPEAQAAGHLEASREVLKVPEIRPV